MTINKLTLTKTDWYSRTGPWPEAEMRLWTGTDHKGNKVICWIPEWVSPDLIEEAMKQFEEHVPVQAARRPRQRKPRVLRANKVKGSHG